MKFFTEELRISLGINSILTLGIDDPTRHLYFLDTLLMLQEIVCSKQRISALVDCFLHSDTGGKLEVCGHLLLE